MKLIDLSKRRSKIASQYADVPQPMVVYHSEEELDSNEKDIIKINNISNYLKVIKDMDIKIKSREYQSVMSKNIWIRTTDKYLPDYTNHEGNIYLVLDDKGNPIPVDSCWIKLYRVYTQYSNHFIFTSSGIWSIGINKWALSAGIKTQFSAVTRRVKSKSTEQGRENYRIYLNKLINKQTPDKRGIRLAHLVLNPLSPYFFNPEKATAAVFKNNVRKEDINKYLTSKAFRSAFMSELGLILPTLTKSIRDAITEEDRKSTRLNSSHIPLSRMPSSA